MSTMHTNLDRRTNVRVWFSAFSDEFVTDHNPEGEAHILRIEHRRPSEALTQDTMMSFFVRPIDWTVSGVFCTRMQPRCHTDLDVICNQHGMDTADIVTLDKQQPKSDFIKFKKYSIKDDCSLEEDTGRFRLHVNVCHVELFNSQDTGIHTPFTYIGPWHTPAQKCSPEHALGQSHIDWKESFFGKFQGMHCISTH
jgi:hypothetical protein